MNNVQPQKHNGLCIGGLIAVFFVPLVGLILSIVGVITGKKKNEKVTCGVIGIVFGAIILLARIILIIICFALLPTIRANVALTTACSNLDSRGNYGTYSEYYGYEDYYSTREGEPVCANFICTVDYSGKTYSKDCRYDD